MTLSDTAPAGLISRFHTGLRKRVDAFLARKPQNRTQLYEPLEPRQMLDANPIQPIGSEFQINTNTAWSSERPEVAVADTGSFVAVWAEHDGSGMGISGQLFNADGTKNGSAFIVNTITAGTQRDASLAMLTDGSFVVTWTSTGVDGDGQSVQGQIFDASGAKLGDEFTVNTTIEYDQFSSDVASASDGSFVVIWQSYNGSNEAEIFAQRFDTKADKQGSEFLVASDGSSPRRPSVAMNNDGSFVFAWNGFPEGVPSILGQQYGSDGILDSEFTVTQGSGLVLLDNPVVASNGLDGSFVVGWLLETYDSVNDSSTIHTYAQRFDASGNAEGSAIKVNAPLGNEDNVRFSSLAVGADSGFLVSWEQIGGVLTDTDVVAQYYDSNGEAQGNNFVVNTTTINSQTISSLAAGPNNTYIAVWIDEGASGVVGIYGQRYQGPIINQAPTAKTIPAQAIEENGSGFLTLSDYFSDDDTPAEELTYTIEGNTNKGLLPAAIEIVDNTPYLNMTPTTKSYGAGTITIRATDSQGEFVEADVYVGVAGAQTRVVQPLADTSKLGDSALVPNYENIGMAADGSYVQVWSNQVGSGVYGQLFNPDGTTNGSSFEITSGANGAGSPDVAVAFDGSFVVTWTQVGDSTTQVYNQRFSPSGTPLDAAFKVNLDGNNHRIGPTVAMAYDGSYVIGWLASFAIEHYEGLAQRFDASGKAIGSIFAIDDSMTSDDSLSELSLAMHPTDGSFTAAWRFESLSDEGDIYGRVFNDQGIGGTEFLVNTTTINMQNQLDISVGTNGQYVIVWRNESQIMAQRYNSVGDKIGNELLLTDTIGNDEPGVTVAADGAFTLAWRKILGKFLPRKLLAQRFDNAGNAVGSVVQILEAPPTTQLFNFTSSGSPSGNFVASWRSYYSGDDAIAVNAQSFELLPPPEFLSFEPVISPTDVTVGSVDLYFSQAIDVDSFNWESITLTRDGGSNLVDETTGAGLTFTLVDGDTNRYQIGGLAALTNHTGEFNLTLVDGAVTDPAGNPIGSGGNIGWTMLAAVPSVPVLSPASEGVPGTGYTSSTTPTVIGTATPGSTVEIYEGETLLGSAAVDENGNYSIELSELSEGVHNLVARAIDGDYTSADSAIGIIHVDTTTVTMTRISWPIALTDYGPLRFAVTFSAPIALSTLTWQDLGLTLDGGANLITSGVGIEITEYTLTPNTYLIKIVPGIRSTPGDYQLTINGSSITNTSGTSVPNSLSKGWTVATKPVRISWPTALDPNYGPVRFAVTFTSLVDLSTFTWADLELTLDGGSNLITSGDGIQISEYTLTPNTYLIKINPAIRSAPGNYQLTVKGAGITGAAGVPVSGNVSKGWNVSIT